MLLSCIISHNRLALTKMTLESYLNTIYVDHFLVVVDNASVDGTAEYLESMEKHIGLLIRSDKNLYPGPACDLGWSAGLEIHPETQYLHRSDNDIFYEIDWDRYSLESFDMIGELGQFGILDLRDQFYPGTLPITNYKNRVNLHFPNVGGNHVTRRKLWDLGLRHNQNGWDNDGGFEDVEFSRGVAGYNYLFGHTIEHIATHLGQWGGSFGDKDYREYYRRTYMQRLNRDIYPNIPISGEEF